jgi:hypothetical protein
MDAETLEALKGSIEKHENILAGTGRDRGTVNCPLCKLFHECEGCPVFEKTGKQGCSSTPYEDWAAHQDFEHDREAFGRVYCPECERLVKLEIEFLKSLLPASV